MSFHNLNYNSSYNPESLDRISESIFLQADGSPMNFSISFDLEGRDQLIKYITLNGGRIVNDNEEQSSQVGIINITNVYKPGSSNFKPEFVWDSLKQGIPLDLQNYKVPSVQIQGILVLLELKLKSTKHPFTPEEDEFILEQVRLQPRRRTTHRLFEEISKSLNSHTGNSIRYRFRNLLLNNLGFVYKTDPVGNPIKDIDGNYIKESLDKIPSTFKNKFTALDDYTLCVKILEHVQREYQKLVADGVINPVEEPLNLDKPLTVPVSFFGTMERLYPNHTRAAWRDRYRKFARVFGIKEYADYYANSKDPEPMKHFTRRQLTNNKSLSKSVDHVTSLLGNTTRYRSSSPSKESEDNKKLSESKEQALDEEIGEIKNSNIHDALIRTTGDVTSTNNSTQLPLVEENEVFEDAREENTQQQQQQATTSTSESNNTDIENDKLDNKRGQKSQLVQQLSQPQLQGEGSQEQIGFSYPRPGISLDEIFNSKFYRIKSEQEALKVVKGIIEEGDENASALFAKFQDEMGFTDYFCTVIILYTNGDYNNIWLYLQHVLHRLYDQELQLGESETFKLLEIEGINGIWNKNYDEMLKSGTESDLEELKQIQDDDLIDLRRAFLDATRGSD